MATARVGAHQQRPVQQLDVAVLGQREELVPGSDILGFYTKEPDLRERDPPTPA
ncbi:MAG: hypothetical protein M3Z25_17940 [Actinomycetota bacterium]|nr:hypothetical protein [Actinomycetota bacterium]